MLRKEWLIVIVLILLPINAWLGVFYYLRWQHKIALQRHFSRERMKEEFTPLIAHFQENFNIKEGQRLKYPFPYPTFVYGSSLPPFGRGIPFLFINISWIAEVEIWQPVIQEALNASPYLHVVLLYSLREENPEGRDLELKAIGEMIKKLHHHRLSALAGHWVRTVFGTDVHGILLVLCDGDGIVRALELYPHLKESPYWKEEVADWRPKLHQAVKKVLDKFFPKGQGR